MKKYGINNLKIAVLALCKVTALIQQILLNKNKGWISFAIKFITQIVAKWRLYKKFDFSQVTNELKDLDKFEIRELILYIADNLNITDKIATQIINKALKIIDEGFDIYELINN